VECRRCGTTLEEGDRFCGDCGAPVGACPSCGTPLTPGKRFCRACGTALAEVAFAAAISSLREHSTPYHLAHGLLDQAAHLLRTNEDEAAAAAISEAADIGERLRCRPLLDRADTFQPARPQTAAS
jgi:predicted amidophosphoribosyltransferase